MELRPGYKWTEVGVIPEEWEVFPIGSLGTFSKGRGIRKDEAASGEIPCIRYGEIYTHHNDIVRSFNSRISDEVARSSKRLFNGDLLFAGSGETKEEIGKCVAFLCDEETYAGGDIIILTPKKGNSKFYGYLFNTPIVVRQKASKGQGDAIVHISSSALSSIIIPFPLLSEQEAIAEALSDMDALIAALDRLIAKKRDLKQAAMQQLLTGQTRLPGFSGEWEVKTLFDLAGARKDLFDDGDWIEAEFLSEDGIRLIQTGNIGEGVFVEKEDKKFVTEDTFQKLRCKEVQEGDILICRLAEPAGRACVLPFLGSYKAITAVDVTIYRPIQIFAHRGYLVHLFNTKKWFQSINERCGGSTRSRISRSELGKIQITIPPQSEQTAIATVLSDMDAEIAALEARRDKTRLLKQGMMQELLTGKTRLV